MKQFKTFREAEAAFPSFIGGLDPLYRTSRKRLAERVSFELTLWEEGEQECDIKTGFQAQKARKYLDRLIEGGN